MPDFLVSIAPVGRVRKGRWDRPGLTAVAFFGGRSDAGEAEKARASRGEADEVELDELAADDTPIRREDRRT